MTTLRIAWRNLWRNPRRTLLALAAIGLSVTLVLAYDAMLRGIGDWMIETITGPLLGHVQVHAAEWRKDRAMDRTLGHATALSAAIAHDPDVASVAARVYAPALAALSDEGFAVIVIGLDRGLETGPQRLLPADAPGFDGKRVLIGRALAETMNVHAGATIAIVGQGADGSLANDLYTVSGLLETPMDLVNRQGVIMTLGEAQALFSMDDEAHELVVHARTPDRVEALTGRVAALPALAGADVLDWKRLQPEMVTLLSLVEVMWLFVLALVFAAAAAGVANTMLMAAFERTREFGMLLALGVSPARIVGMILAESVALGAVGAAAGAALGVGLVAATHGSGLDFAALTGGGPNEISFMGMRWSMRLYPSLTPIDLARAVGAVVITSVVASVWPAIRVGRLQPATALRS
jgi:ABC-type lipoprotein release transport system permease subunit